MKLKHLVAFTMFLFIGMLCLSSVNATTLNDNLTDVWLMDENTGTTIFNEIGTDDGTLNGVPTWATGKINSGLDFDGSNDYVFIDSTFSSIKTLSVWFNSDTTYTSTSTSKRMLFGSTNNLFYWIFGTASGSFNDQMVSIRDENTGGFNFE